MFIRQAAGPRGLCDEVSWDGERLDISKHHEREKKRFSKEEKSLWETGQKKWFEAAKTPTY